MKKSSFINFFKGKIAKVFIIDIVFFSLLLWFLAYARNRIYSYIIVIQQFAPKISDISSTLNSNNPLSVPQLDALLKVLDPIISEAKFFVFIVIPVMVFLLWVFFQGLGWNFLKQDSFKKAIDIRLYPSFAIASIPLFAVLVFAFNDFLNMVDSFNISKSVIIFVLLFVVLYFTIISYLVLGKTKFFLRLVHLSIKRIWIFFPAFLLMFFLLLVAFVFSFDAYISILSLVVPSFLSIFLILFSIFLFSSSKCLLAYLSE